jgi:uncharacterized delta-60 repeat protein
MKTWVILLSATVFAIHTNIIADTGETNRILTNIGGYDSPSAVEIQPDGKIVVAGRSDGSVAVLRYHSDGTLDTDFGNHGRATPNLAESGFVVVAMALDRDGRVIVAGYTVSNLALARYTANGTLDTSFGNNGVVLSNFRGGGDLMWRCVTVQPDGKIVAGGTAGWCQANFVLSRYNPDGSLDNSFGEGGTTETDLGSIDYMKEVIVLPDGKIIAAGDSLVRPSHDFAVVRYKPNGSLDDSFGKGGKVTTDFGSNRNELCSGAVVQSDGKIVLVGTTYSEGVAGSFALARYDTDGALDPSFGNGGLVITDWGLELDRAYCVGIRNDGKLAVGGDVIVNGWYGFGIACYETNGELDQSFGNNGKATSFFEGLHAFCHDLAIDAQGDILAVGDVRIYSQSDFGLVFYDWPMKSPVRYWLDLNIRAGRIPGEPNDDPRGFLDVESGWFNEGTEVIVTATPAKGYYFGHWSGNHGTAQEHANPITITMSQNRKVVAHFNKDTDHDGICDEDEYFITGTDYRNSNDVLAIRAIMRGDRMSSGGGIGAAGGDEGGVTLEWPSVLGKLYTVERSTDILSGFTPIRSNLPGSGGIIRYHDSDSNANAARHLFYRIVVGE